MHLRMLSACAPHNGFWINPTACSGQDQDPSVETIAAIVSMDLLLVCYLANATCAIINIMTTLIFIIVSRLHAFFLVVVVRSFLHTLMVVAENYYFQHPHTQIPSIMFHMFSLDIYHMTIFV